MAGFVGVARVGDLAPGRKMLVRVQGAPVVLANVGGVYYAIGDTCPHAGASLAEGRLHGDSIQCPLHGWEFRLEDGRCTLDFIRVGAKPYRVRIEDGEIQVAPAG